MFHPDRDVAHFNQLSKDHFPAYIGVQITEVEENRIAADLEVKPHLFAPNGFLHAGTIVTFADTIAGYSTIAHLPEGGKSFTTLELKSNFIRAARKGFIACESSPEHMGRTTQVWRVRVWDKQTGKKIAIFHCTQLILY